MQLNHASPDIWAFADVVTVHAPFELLGAVSIPEGVRVVFADA